MSYAVTVKPVNMPISVSEAKSHLNLFHDDDDGLIYNMILAATSYVETEIRRKLITQTIEVYLDDFPYTDEIVLPVSPVQSLSSITYLDDDEVQTAFPVANVTLNDKKEPHSLVLKPRESWATQVGDYPNAVTITLVVGYGGVTDVPKEIRAAMFLLIDHWYQNGAETMRQGFQENPVGVKSLLQHHRYTL